MRIIAKLQLGLLAVTCLLIGCKNVSEEGKKDETHDSYKKQIPSVAGARERDHINLQVSYDRGMKLYGDYYFDARDGSISSVYKEDLEVVPPGAVLVAVKKYYIMGYYEGDIEVLKNGKTSNLNRVFFCIYKDGEFEFGMPYPEYPLVMGEKIEGEVLFGVYKSENKGTH